MKSFPSVREAYDSNQKPSYQPDAHSERSPNAVEKSYWNPDGPTRIHSKSFLKGSIPSAAATELMHRGYGPEVATKDAVNDPNGHGYS